MSEWETARLVGEIVSILGFLGGGFWYMAKLLYRTHSKLDTLEETVEGLDKKQGDLNNSVSRHFEEDNTRFSHIQSQLDILTGKVDALMTFARSGGPPS